MPVAGLVIRYVFLWSHEAATGRDEGTKDRPCAVVLVSQGEDKKTIVRVLPVTHSRPSDLSDALEIPPLTKKRLGLDEDQSWIILDEANEFVWPGPDLRPKTRGQLDTVAYGHLPGDFFRLLNRKIQERAKLKRSATVRRTE